MPLLRKLPSLMVYLVDSREIAPTLFTLRHRLVAP
jgi:hypothetical protein